MRLNYRNMWAEFARVHFAAVGFPYHEWTESGALRIAEHTWGNRAMKGELIEDLKEIYALAQRVHEHSLVVSCKMLSDFIDQYNAKQAALEANPSPKRRGRKSELGLAKGLTPKERYEQTFKSEKWQKTCGIKGKGICWEEAFDIARLSMQTRSPS